MVLIQRPEWGGGEVWFDGELIRKNGMFVPRDLRPAQSREPEVGLPMETTRAQFPLTLPSPQRKREKHPPRLRPLWRLDIPSDGPGTLSSGLCIPHKSSTPSPIPKGLCPPAQGCEQRATLGELRWDAPTPMGLPASASPLYRRNPVGVDRARPFPRVARGSQPWALRRNSFGIRLLDNASRGECSASGRG